MKTKGIILAGGKGTRLYPMTYAVSKQLQPIYDKPMIYYPLAILMLGGIRDVLIISTPEDTPNFARLLGDGSRIGMNFEYIVQDAPRGLPEAFILGEKFLGNDNACLILGDNLFYGKLNFFRQGLENNQGGTIFAYRVDNPSSYGVVEFDSNNNVLSIEEKPKAPKSNFAIPGLYIFDNKVSEISKNLQPSARGELEITDIHKAYLEIHKLRVEVIGRGIAWLDTGTFESLLQASQFVEVVQNRQGLKIGCIEEIAFRMKFISREQLTKIAEPLLKSGYGQYLINLQD